MLKKDSLQKGRREATQGHQSLTAKKLETKHLLLTTRLKRESTQNFVSLQVTLRKAELKEKFNNLPQ